MLLGYGAFAWPILALPVILWQHPSILSGMTNAALPVYVAGSIVVLSTSAIWSIATSGFSAKPSLGQRLKCKCKT
jgi:hypothetical protein